MAIDPRISLAADAGNIGNIFSNALSTAQQAQTLQQNRELAPIQNQLLQAQAAQAESGVEQSQQLNRVRSLAIYGQNATPFLQSGDLEGLREFTVNRSGELAAQGTPNNDTADALAIIDNPAVSREQKIQGLSELAARAQQNAISLGALQAPAASGGLASAKTEIYEDGTIINALPDGTSQVINPSGQVVEGQDRIDTLRTAKESGLAQLQAESDIAVEEARLKAGATNRASRISTITSEMSERNRTAKRGEINLAQAAILVEQAAQGVEGVNKVRLARLFPGIDVSNEAALSQSLTNLALDELQKFSGPTTDFEFQKTEEIAGTLGDSQTANRAKIASLQRANWFNQREAKQFQEHAKSGGDPDTFGFNFGEPVKTKKGVFTLRDIQDTAVANNISIDDALKRLNQ